MLFGSYLSRQVGNMGERLLYDGERQFRRLRFL